MRHLLSGVASRDGNPFENPFTPLSSARLIEMFTGGPTAAGVLMNELEAPKTTAVYRAVALLAGLMGYIPLKTYEPGPDGEARRDISHQIGVIEQPYPDMTAYEWKNVMAWQYFLWGNTYALKIRNEVGSKVLRMLPLPPGDIKPRREKPTALNPSGKFFESSVMHFRDYTPYEILHIPGPGYDGVKGLSPIAMARQALAVGRAAETYGAELFGQGTLQGHALTTDQELEDDDAERLKKRWQEKVAGLAHAHELLVLDNGAKLEKLALTPEDAEFIATREFGVYDVARLYGIPPHLLMVKDATSNWGTGVEVHALQMLTFTLSAHLTAWEQKLTAHGRPDTGGVVASGAGWLPAGAWHEFLVDALLRIDAKTRAESYKHGIQWGYLSRAEVRVKENEPPLPGLDKPLIPMNMREAGDRDPKTEADTIGSLFRAGFTPESIVEAVTTGALEKLVPTGERPITLRPAKEALLGPDGKPLGDDPANAPDPNAPQDPNAPTDPGGPDPGGSDPGKDPGGAPGGDGTVVGDG